MVTHKSTPAAEGARAVQIVVFLEALFYLFTSLALLFQPAWFYENIGPFPPFNRHYMGDLGAFLLALTIGLFFAARRPARHAALIGVVALGGSLHLGNHVYDDLISGAWTLSHALTETLPLAILAAAAIWAWWRVRR